MPLTQQHQLLLDGLDPLDFQRGRAVLAGVRAVLAAEHHERYASDVPGVNARSLDWLVVLQVLAKLGQREVYLFPFVRLQLMG